jgi:hypothetical protein
MLTRPLGLVVGAGLSGPSPFEQGRLDSVFQKGFSKQGLLVHATS